MPVWLRLTCFFGLPDEAAQSDILFLDSLGPILRADGREIVEAPLPAQFREMLNQLERRQRNVRARQHAVMRRRQERNPMPDIADNTTAPVQGDTICRPPIKPANSESLTNMAGAAI
jgi:hypothetical protein